MNIRASRKEYKVVSCTSCGHLQVTFAERYFVCHGCGKKNYVNPKYVLYTSKDPKDVRTMLISLKMKRACRL